MDWQDGDSKRVAWTPNPRLIRYYTTLGLLDRAAHFQGRVAFYSGKHLLQILAIKYLQTQGRTLEEIQKLILGLSEEALAQMLGIKLPLPAPEVMVPQPVEIPSRRESFWQEIPARRLRDPSHMGNSRPQRLLQCHEPIQGVQILIDPAMLPKDFDLENFLDSLQKLVQSKHTKGAQGRDRKS